ncbi:TMEM165/GDT1 family protein [Rugosimonospora acidiphila]|uniref:GDT1 family protein n=1 Tax=Rugosimonospora acidiphila TaxID=556531 RepID=A0ABP9SQI8_9ACTN
MNLAVIATVAPLIFLAELPDKTALASLVLGTRYRASYVFSGAAAAFTLHVVLAVAVGALLGLLPHRALEAVVGALFLFGAVLLLRGRDDDESHGKQRDAAGFWRVSAMSFVIILVAEFGDLTQILTANLAAKYRDPFSVGLGSVIGLWAVAGLAILGGQGLLRVVPMKWVIRAAATVMLVLSVVSLVGAIRG